MATVNLILDKRSKRKDGTHSVKMILFHGGKKTSISTGFYVDPDNWADGKFTGYNSKMINARLQAQLARARVIFQDLQAERKLKHMSLNELRYRIENNNQAPEIPVDKYFVSEHADKFIKTCRSESTASLYELTRKKVVEFGGQNVAFQDIDYAWLKNFENHLLSKDIKINSISIFMRNLRALFNDAIRRKLIGREVYPFTDYSVRTEETEKRCLTIDQLRTLRDYLVLPHQEKYRDLFMLMFYLIGINAKDLFDLTEKDYRDGRIHYQRLRGRTKRAETPRARKP